MSVPCKSSPAALQLVHPCLGACLFGWLAGWLADLSWKSLRQHLRNCDHHGFFCLRVWGLRWQVCPSPPLHVEAETLCRDDLQ